MSKGSKEGIGFKVVILEISFQTKQLNFWWFQESEFLGNKQRLDIFGDIALSIKQCYDS